MTDLISGSAHQHERLAAPLAGMAAKLLPSVTKSGEMAVSEKAIVLN